MPRSAPIYEDLAASNPDANPHRDDVVGRLSGGYKDEKGNPVSLDTWRFTSDDPEVIDTIAELLGGEPQQTESERDGETYVTSEVFTDAKSLDIILDDSESVSTEFVQRDRDFKPFARGDGRTIDNGTKPDPGAHLELAERKEQAKRGLVPAPEVTIYFRLADAPELGVFSFTKYNAWNLIRSIERDSFFDKLDDAVADGYSARAKLSREPVSFKAKSGPRAGKTVSYTDTVLKFKGVLK